MPKKDNDHGGFEAVPAVIVADERSQLGRRLGVAAIALLILFFVISIYIQSKINGAALVKAETNRADIANELAVVNKTLEDQLKIDIDLEHIILEQNKALVAHGLPPIIVAPGSTLLVVPLAPTSSPTPHVR